MGCSSSQSQDGNVADKPVAGGRDEAKKPEPPLVPPAAPVPSSPPPATGAPPVAGAPPSASASASGAPPPPTSVGVPPVGGAGDHPARVPVPVAVPVARTHAAVPLGPPPKVTIVDETADSRTFECSHLPFNGNDLIAVRGVTAWTPEGGALCFMLALLKYAVESDSEPHHDHRYGLECLIVATHSDKIEMKGGVSDLSSGVKNDWHERIGLNPHIARSYVIGSRAANSYAVAQPYRFTFYADKVPAGDPNRRRVFVACAGSDAPRPLSLSKNTADIWKVTEWSSIQGDVKRA